MIKKPGFLKTRFSDSDIEDWLNDDLPVQEEDDDIDEEPADFNDTTNRCSTFWRKEILSRYKHCIVSGVDKIECDAAHVVLFYLCTEANIEWGTDPANGIHSSKILHCTFDRLLWILDPI